MDNQFQYLISSVNGSGFDDGIVSPNLEQSNLDILFKESGDSVNGSEWDDGIILPNLEQPMDPCSFAPLYNLSSEVDFPGDHESYPVIKYINQMLMEENMEEQPSMCHDPLALQAAEKSFYEILGKNYPPSPSEPPADLDNNVESPDGSSEHDRSTTDTGGTSVDPQSILDPIKLSEKQYHRLDNSFDPYFRTNSVQYLNPLKNSSNSGGGQMGSFTNKNLISSLFCDSETILQFMKGLEEGSKFLPTGIPLISDLDKYTLPSKLEDVELEANGKKDEKEHSVNGLRRRNHQHLDDSDSDIGIRNKQSAVYVDEVELSEAFDRILLYVDSRGQVPCCDVDVEQPTGLSETLHWNEGLHGSNVGKSPEQGGVTDSEAFDLSALLISCAQSVVADDRRTAHEQLKLIRKHASYTGNPHQRLASVFANALEARLAGTGPDLYVALTHKPVSAAEELKAYRTFLCTPFRQIACFFANKMILEAASKAKTLHIVDFGIGYGFHWPSLVQQLSDRAGGPPKLRITGIDLPQPGFWPEEMIEKTGSRLAKYCERFNVPFEYQAIAIRSWEKIRIEDLKLARNEVLTVNCQLRFQSLLDETVEDGCPRDAVLSLIRKMNPNIFVNDILNAPLTAPFFLNRFREALFFYSTIFDAIDNNLPRKDKQRMKFEQECLGAEMMNVIACEGSARVERPETYKQWQIRYKRAGFRLLPLNQDLVKELRNKVKEGYHKDFTFDEDGYWVLLGWKGKIITARSCCVPA